MIALVLVAVLLSGAVAASDGLLVEQVNLVSPQYAGGKPRQNVLIIDGRIRRVSSQPIEAGPEIRRVDGRGKFLAPGLMDSHAHVSLIPGLGFWGSKEASQYPALVQAYLRQQPRSHLYYGVTQILDPSPGLAWRQFIAAPRHPDFLRCEVLASPSTFPMVTYDGKTAQRLFPYYIDEPDSSVAASKKRTPEAMIQRMVDDGAQCIKLYFEDGYGSASDWPLLDRQTLADIREIASRHGLPILAHANATDMYQQAMAVGVDVFVHGLWSWGAENRAEGVPEAVRKTLDGIRQEGLGVMSTQRVLAGLGEMMLPETLDDPALRPVTPPSLLAWYRQPAAQWFKHEVLAGFDGLPPARVATIFKHQVQARGARAMAYLQQHGHPLLLGSDFPGSPSFANQPGLTTYREMVAMADAGIPLTDILAAATINNARQFNLADDYGSVAEGKVANLLLLKDNPLERISAWDSIETVFLRGRAISRASLAVGALPSSATDNRRK